MSVPLRQLAGRRTPGWPTSVNTTSATIRARGETTRWRPLHHKVARTMIAAVTAVSIVARLVLLNGGWAFSTSAQVDQAAAGTPQNAKMSRKTAAGRHRRQRMRRAPRNGVTATVTTTAHADRNSGGTSRLDALDTWAGIEVHGHGNVITTTRER